MEYCTRELTKHIRENRPIGFIKLGDGEYYCANYHNGHNCDCDNYTPKKGTALIHTFKYINSRLNNIYFGMWWNTENKKFWENFSHYPVHWTNYHAINIDDHDMNRKDHVLKDKIELFKTIKVSKIKKVYICNELLQKVKLLLNVDKLIHVAPSNWFDTEFDRVLEEAKKEYDENGTIFLFSCGMGAKPLIGELFRCFPNAIYLDVGSALDFICTQRNSRGVEYTYNDMKEQFQELLPEGWDDSCYDELVRLSKIHLGRHLPQ